MSVLDCNLPLRLAKAVKEENNNSNGNKAKKHHNAAITANCNYSLTFQSCYLSSEIICLYEFFCLWTTKSLNNQAFPQRKASPISNSWMHHLQTKCICLWSLEWPLLPRLNFLARFQNYLKCLSFLTLFQQSCSTTTHSTSSQDCQVLW